MRRFFSTIMLYAVILIGFSWVYHNNDNARAAVNRIAYVAQTNFQQLKSRVTGRFSQDAADQQRFRFGQWSLEENNGHRLCQL